MFSRKDESYEIDDNLLQNILLDEASPINRIVELIPENSKILDVGSGNGVLAKVFKISNKNIIIDGIEPNKFASELAKTNYRKFYTGYVQDFIKEILEEKYDYIIFADVIEHIVNPIEVLSDFFKQLESNTKIILSVPNIAFGSIRLSLMKGYFEYIDSGILEKTHVRFYTLDTLKNLINLFNLNLEKLYFLNRNYNNMEVDISKLKLNPLYLYFVNNDKLSHVYQFLCVLSKNEVEMEVKSYGKKIKFPFLEYYLRPIIMKNERIKNFLKKIIN